MQKLAKCLAVAAIGASTFFIVACQEQNGLERASEAPVTDLEKQSYAIGRSMATGLKQGEIEFDRAAFNAGFYDVFDDVQRMTDEEMGQVLVQVQQAAMQKQMEKQAAESKVAQEAAEKFLAENAEKEGVVTLESGLQYKVLVDTEGDKPAATDQVTVHYEGRLVDGQVFDSSLQRGEPATFKLNQVIAGWTEALQLMSPGAKWQLYIPPELAYGEREVGQLIKPFSALVFDVELLAIGDNAPVKSNDEIAEQESVAEETSS